MHPFLTNHLTSTPQQGAGGSSNALPNRLQIQSQMGFVNPQSSIPNNNIPLNIPNFNTLQNAHMGNSNMLGSSQQFHSNASFLPNNIGQNLNGLGFPFNGQLGNLGQGNQNQLFVHNNPLINGWQNPLQSMNLFGNMPLLNPSQVNALTQLLGVANQVAQGMVPQNSTFLGNPWFGSGHTNGGLVQTNFGQQLPVASQQLQNVSGPSFSPAASSHQLGQSSNLNLQGNHGHKQGMQFPNSTHHPNKNYNNSKREASNRRFQKSQDHQTHNPRGKQKFSNTNEGKGKIVAPDDSANQSNGGKRRSLALLYTEKEIQQWREERKKNFPSKSNMEKKLEQKQANADAADEEAKLRREQLKDVLAKQVELGFEVPEIPSHYLVDPEEQGHGRDKSKRLYNKGRFQNHGRFKNKFNRGGKSDNKDQFSTKRGTENDGSVKKHERFAKRQRVEDGNLSNTPLHKKDPTLLQKLLKNEIKRDNSHLLQALRFMVINNFFKEPEKPLIFPKVIVKETGLESDVIEGKASISKEELSNHAFDDISDESDGGGNDRCQEEGEITD